MSDKHPRPGSHGYEHQGPPPGREEKAGQQARPGDARPERPTAPHPPPPTSEGKTD